MSALVDSSSPIRFTNTVAVGVNITSAAFTAPAGSYFALSVQIDCGNETCTFSASDTGGSTWAQQVKRDGSETTTGGASAWCTAVAAGSGSRTVSVNVTGYAGTVRVSAKLYVITGADVAGTPLDTIGANNENGSLTNSINTTSLTPGANGLLLVSDCEFNALGSFDASSDLTQDTTTYAGAISVCDGYKTCTSGVGVTANLDAAGSSAAQHKWCQIIVREAATAALSVLARPRTRPFPFSPGSPPSVNAPYR